MDRRLSLLLRLTAAAFVVTLSSPALAVLQDRGPQDPTLVFPTWYRDLNQLALQPCLSQTDSPNAPGTPMCFPINPDPAGFAGNVGGELFYSDLTLSSKGPNGFSVRYVAALEATYLPLGVPLHGSETVFARVRIVIGTPAPGVYKVTHPYGVEVFEVTAPGPRAVFFTNDVPIGPALDFDSALQGQVGPFPQWDFVDVGSTLTVTSAAGVTEEFAGDPNVSHTFTGSPFGTNYLRVDGPAGANISGVGDDFVQVVLANVLGQKYLKAIPTPLTVKRATYSRDPARNVVGIDVFATSAPGSQMVVTGAGMPSVQMKTDGRGDYFAHVEIPATSIPPAAVIVTNATSNPANSVSVALKDLVNITSATFDTLTNRLAVTAASSDLLAPGPALTVSGPFGGAMAAGAFGATLAAGALPPLSVSVVSSAGGVDSDDVVILPGLTDARPFPPVAVADAFATSMNTAVNLNLAANDAITPPALVAQVVVVSQPANGTVTPIGINTGVVTYTPNLNYFNGGAVPADTFQYVVVDTTGAVSNVATASVAVNFVAAAPTANGDDFAMVQNSATLLGRTVNVLANDAASAGTTLNPASVTVTTRPLHGNAVVNADGTITYTPVLRYVGADSFRYTVANGAGIASAPATVNVVVEGGAEVLSFAKVNFKVSTNQWTITGSTNWFGPTLTHTTATCYVGRGTSGAKIGTALVDTAGRFQLVPPSNVAPPADATNVVTCQTSNGGVSSAAVSRI